jgi:hypothetical protein
MHGQELDRTDAADVDLDAALRALHVATVHLGQAQGGSEGEAVLASLSLVRQATEVLTRTC